MRDNVTQHFVTLTNIIINELKTSNMQISEVKL